MGSALPPSHMNGTGDNGRSLGAYQIMNVYYADAVVYNPSLGDDGRTYSDVWGIGSEAYSIEVI